MLKNKDLRKIKSSVAYTIQKYAAFIDFSKLSDINALQYRYLMKNIIILQEHYKEILIQKEKENNDN